ncbi:MAG: hypothetical protein QXS41_00655 [Candidatus Woesearchaeota archaeon]
MRRFKGRENFFIVSGLVFGLFVSLFLQNSSVLLSEGLHIFTGNLIKEMYKNSLSEKCFPKYDDNYNIEYYYCNNLTEKEIDFLLLNSAQIKKIDNSFFIVSFRDKPERWN